MLTAVLIALLGGSVAPALVAPAATAAPAPGDRCGICELPDPDSSAAPTADPDGDDAALFGYERADDDLAVREACAEAAESNDRRNLAACEEEAERALRLLREAGIPWGESELPADRPADPGGPVCRDDSSCGPAPAAPVLRNPTAERSSLPPDAPELAPPCAAAPLLHLHVAGQACDGFARIPERPPCA
jgi:hypothetical protein